MKLGAFTYIIGIATLLALMLQVKDSFPAHRETRKAIVLLVIGIFIGTLIGSFQNINISLKTPISASSILIAFLVLVFSIVVIITTLTPDYDKRQDLFAFLAFFGMGLGLLIFLVMLGATVPIKTQAITTDELIEISNSNLSKGNFERSILMLNKVKDRVERSDPRYKLIENKINEIKKKQVENVNKK